ncbi:hypothetical protein DPMN_073864 [Dreissena polymorpha]|uniref:Uncharacterized protein n=1 Tax=Dreissena polymorpha TaxID=45954 RepID=A0A9D3YHL0_DREPO|nr:hypothetical protein DPMN_073864 [Dreissena polymorpha]
MLVVHFVLNDLTIPASATLIFDIELMGIEGVTDQQPTVQLVAQPSQTFGAAGSAAASSGGVAQFSSANFAPQSLPSSQPAQPMGAASFGTQGVSSGGVSQFSTANFAPQSPSTEFQGFSSISQFPPVNSGVSTQGFSGAASSASSSQGFSTGFTAQTAPSFTQPQPQREQPQTPSFTAPEPPRPQQPSGFGTMQFGSNSMFPSSSIGSGQPPVVSFTAQEPPRSQQPNGFGTMQFASQPQSTFSSSRLGSGQPQVVSPPPSPWNPPSSLGAGFRSQNFAPSSPPSGFDTGSRTSAFDFQGSRFGQTEQFERESTLFPSGPTGPGFPVDRGMVSRSGPGMGVPGQPETFGRFGPPNDFTAAGGDFTDFRSSFEMPPFAGSPTAPGMRPSDRLGMPEGAVLGFDSRRDPRLDMARRLRPGFGSMPPRFGGTDMLVGGADMRMGMPPMRGGAPFMTPVRSPFRRLIRRRRAVV